MDHPNSRIGQEAETMTHTRTDPWGMTGGLQERLKRRDGARQGPAELLGRRENLLSLKVSKGDTGSRTLPRRFGVGRLNCLSWGASMETSSRDLTLAGRRDELRFLLDSVAGALGKVCSSSRPTWVRQQQPLSVILCLKRCEGKMKACD